MDQQRKSNCMRQSSIGSFRVTIKLPCIRIAKGHAVCDCQWNLIENNLPLLYKVPVSFSLVHI